MARVSFKKYEGLGNDFILLELPSESLGESPSGVSVTAISVSEPMGSFSWDKRAAAGAAATMVIRNADGSQPEMCGNGIRCVAIHVARKKGRETAEFTIDTDAGPLGCKVQNDEVEVEMGKLADLGPSTSARRQGAPFRSGLGRQPARHHLRTL